MSTKLKGIIGIFLINILLIGLGITLLELSFGNWIRSDNLNRLNIIRSKSIKFDITGLYKFSSTTAIYTRDQYGLRGSFKNPSEINILTVGGSTTDQKYITDGLTWQDLLQQKFQSIGKNVIVANAGVDGQSTMGHIKNFDWWFPNIPNLRPKYILFYIGINDFYKVRGYRLVKRDRLLKDENRSLRGVLSEKSALYHALRTLRGMYQAKQAGLVDYIRQKHIDSSKVEWTAIALQSSYDGLMQNPLKYYTERLNLLIAKTKEIGSIPILVTQPSCNYRVNNGVIEGTKEEYLYDNVPINGVDYYYMKRKLDEVTISVCRIHNIDCLDIAKETRWEDEDFYDFWHMTPQGAEKVGSALFDKLKEKF